MESTSGEHSETGDEPCPLQFRYTYNSPRDEKVDRLLRAVSDGYIPKIKSELSRWTWRLRFLCALDVVLTPSFLLLLLVRVSVSDRIKCCGLLLLRRNGETADGANWDDRGRGDETYPGRGCIGAGLRSGAHGGVLWELKGLQVPAQGAQARCQRYCQGWFVSIFYFCFLHDVRWVSTRRDGMVRQLDQVSEHGKGDFDLIYGICRGFSLFVRFFVLDKIT
jgi:hypothetical protein